MVQFAGWELPLHYGSQVSEHHAVRATAGVFDVSHLALTEVSGRGAKAFLRRLLANDIDRLGDRVAGLYTCLLNDSGCVLDDLIAYRLADDRYRVVSNAATIDSVHEQLHRVARAFPVNIAPEEGGVTLAVQGPQAMERGAAVAGLVISREFADALAAVKPFNAMDEAGVLAARTGYTGEDGFEIYLDRARGKAFWQALLEAGVAPCGLGRARHAAAGGRPLPVRPGHGRHGDAAALRAEVDRGYGTAGAALHRPARAGRADGKRGSARFQGCGSAKKGYASRRSGGAHSARPGCSDERRLLAYDGRFDRPGAHPAGLVCRVRGPDSWRRCAVHGREAAVCAPRPRSG